MHFPAKLTQQQKGRIAEELAVLKFLSWGFEVYQPEVDEKGIDLIVRHPQENRFYEIQVKGITGKNYSFFRKATVNPETSDIRYVCYVRLDAKPDQAFFLIPLAAWDGSNPLFPIRNYDHEGCSSAPEYGIVPTKKNEHLLEQFCFDKTIGNFLGATEKE